jgi:GPN-loop GTPase
MKYCEIVIGPPGSGKSTYVQKKYDSVKHRNPYLVNLDPGNIHTDLYDYNIQTSVKDYQIKNDKGPNGSTKDILSDFVNNIHDFYYEYIEDKENYFIFDLPGQVEFFIAGDSLSTMINFLSKKDINIVVVNLIDLVFFNTSLLSSYLFTYISICRMEVPFVCVITKCDKYHLYDMKYNLKEIASLSILDILDPDKKYKKTVADFLNDYFVYNFQILNYEDENTECSLRLCIDRCSGYCFSDEFNEKETYFKKIDPDSLFDNYTLK